MREEGGEENEGGEVKVEGLKVEFQCVFFFRSNRWYVRQGGVEEKND